MGKKYYVYVKGTAGESEEEIREIQESLDNIMYFWNGDWFELKLEYVPAIETYLADPENEYAFNILQRAFDRAEKLAEWNVHDSGGCTWWISEEEVE